MKKLVLALLVLLTSLAASAAKPKPNPADYGITVHVVGSHGGSDSLYQLLEAVIDGQTVDLRGQSRGVLALGDYKAQLKPGVNPPKSLNAYDVYRGYEVLLPDGTTRYYEVVGFGIPEPAAATVTNP